MEKLLLTSVDHGLRPLKAFFQRKMFQTLSRLPSKSEIKPVLKETLQIYLTVLR